MLSKCLFRYIWDGYFITDYEDNPSEERVGHFIIYIYIIFIHIYKFYFLLLILALNILFLFFLRQTIFKKISYRYS